MEERISKNYHFKPQVYKELEKWEQKAEKLKWQIQVTRACLKIKNCTKHVFLSPFHDRIKKKGAFICQDVMN